MKNTEILKKLGIFVLKLLGAAAIGWISFWVGLYLFLLLPTTGLHIVLVVIAIAILPALIPLLFIRNRAKYMTFWSGFLVLFIFACEGNLVWYGMDQETIIDTNPSIQIHEYLPFNEESKIVTLDHEASLRFTLEDELPRIDGAAAVFPVYSAFVHATYPPERTYYTQNSKPYGSLSTEYFQYNNTPGGYASLADKNTDIFFGAYPSDEQIAYAKKQGTEFIYTPIGYEAFVFFVHKDNPIDSLTVEQIKGIYSGEITNWSQVGGNFEPIVAYQRNKNSGSQSMLIRFMGDTTLASPPSELVSGSMGGIIETVADYRSKSNSMGFSFRYYVEGIIQNPDIKIIAINGIAPTVENIQNGTYPIIGPLYAVTWEGNDNPNVQRLLDWVLSKEGQEIIEKTGYTPVN